eukprot:TRINITY_DN15539_c0_g1_i1.p1 TRINITY_DN15539_c0_g1~~TRINITY_DN15539_c0_g1_i1.p1  ORF type:complete len:221 (-),score=32.74 TRINITY_DN15539_c0_g1_i1:156-818(-)
MTLELRNMISGEVTEVDFEFPGNVWQLKCRVARTFPDVPLDGASEGVQLWKVTESGEAGDNKLLTDEYEELEMPNVQLPLTSSTVSTPVISFAYLLKRRTTFVPWKDMGQVYSWEDKRQKDWYFKYSQDVNVLENMWGIKSFDEFVHAASEHMLRSPVRLLTSWSTDDFLVRFMLRAADPESKRCAVVSRAGKDQVQEILFYEHGGRYHMTGERYLPFFE